MLTSTFFISLCVSWVLLASLNFAYPLLHDYTGINENIALYGPRNRIKPDFNQTTREERIRLFAGIVKSIHLQGEGLGELTYHTKNGKEIKLLTAAEVVHLKDVSVLYEKLKYSAIAVFFIWFWLMVMRFRWRLKMPGTAVLVSYVLLVPVSTSVVYIAGAEKLFYTLHTLFFPAGHQWFFYYEESLMSMMMKAPDMFAYIAVMLVVFALCISVTIFFLAKSVAQINQT